MNVTAARERPQTKRAFVVIAYVAVFFGALPTLLWKIGGRVDLLLDLPRASTGVFGAVLAAAGVGFMAWSMTSLSRRGEGLPISHLPPARLVERGPYARMRHPIYVGYAAAFAGVGLALGSLGRGVFATLLLALGSVAYAMGFEEPRLRVRFGAAYRAYAEAVPAFPWPRAIALSSWRAIRPLADRIANRVVLFRLGPTLWVSYGAFAGAGAALGLGTVHVLVRRFLTLREEAVYLAGLALAMLAGARLVALFYSLPLLLTRPREALRRVGFVSWGGYLGMFAAPFVLGHALGKDGWWLLDRTFVGGLVCSALGRVGCLAYGCCYGRIAAHGVRFHDPRAKANREHPEAISSPRVPTQLLSAASVVALIPFVLVVVRLADPGVGATLGSIVYCLARLAVECLRDEERVLAGFTRGQIASGAGAFVWIVILFASRGGVAPIAIEPAAGGGLAIVGAASVVVFSVCSIHWKRVGRW